jgi:outer membrane lipoprotein-sorting protein
VSLGRFCDSKFGALSTPLLAALLISGCVHVSKTQKLAPAQVKPQLEASQAQLIEKYNKQAAAIQSLNAAVTLTPTAGSQYSGVIQQYHQVDGFILAQRPANIRVIGQAPIVKKNIFDMVSDGQTFQIYIPSKNKFITGPAHFESKTDKPIENLRPQHLLDALFWQQASEDRPVIFEEADDAAGRAYVLEFLRHSKGAEAHPDEVDTRVRFDRSDLNISQIEIFSGNGRLESKILYQDWRPEADIPFPHTITVMRPHDDYQLGIKINKITLNQPVEESRFHLAQPAGTDLVQVGQTDNDQTGKEKDQTH